MIAVWEGNSAYFCVYDPPQDLLGAGPVILPRS